MAELKKEDLITKCTKCEAPSTYPGLGQNYSSSGVIACEKCGGHGDILTDQGEFIRTFILWLKYTGQLKG